MANRFREKPEEVRQTQRGTAGAEDSAAGRTSASGQTAAREQAAAPEVAAAAAEKAQIGKTGRMVSRLLGGEMLADEVVVSQWKVVLLVLCCFLAVVANRYHVEGIYRERDEARQNVKYLREAKLQMQKRYQQGVRISRIAEELKESGVGIIAGPPYEIEK